MLLLIVAAFVGYAGYVVASVIGLAAGAGAVLCLWMLRGLMTSPNEGQTFHDFRMRSSEIYRTQHEALRERRQKAASGTFER
jgi:hypothetical protein